jgi:hypothetical protein
VGLLPDTKKSNLISRQLISVQPLIDLSPFPQSHHNSPSLEMSLACLKLKKKKNSPAGPTGSLRATIVILSIQKTILRHPNLPSFCIQVRCFRQRTRILALQGPVMLMFSLASLIPAPPHLCPFSFRVTRTNGVSLDRDHDVRS